MRSMLWRRCISETVPRMWNSAQYVKQCPVCESLPSMWNSTQNVKVCLQQWWLTVVCRKDVPGADLGAVSWRAVCHLWLYDVDAGGLRRRRHWVCHQQTAARCQLQCRQGSAGYDDDQLHHGNSLWPSSGIGIIDWTVVLQCRQGWAGYDQLHHSNSHVNTWHQSPCSTRLSRV